MAYSKDAFCVITSVRHQTLFKTNILHIPTSFTFIYGMTAAIQDATGLRGTGVSQKCARFCKKRSGAGVSGECALFPGTGVTAPLNPGPALRLWELRIQNEVFLYIS